MVLHDVKMIITFETDKNDVTIHENYDVMNVADVKIAPGQTSYFRQIVHFYDSNIRQKLRKINHSSNKISIF